MFADDVLQCPCGGRRSVIAIVTDPALARTLLTALGLASELTLGAFAWSDTQRGAVYLGNLDAFSE